MRGGGWLRVGGVVGQVIKAVAAANVNCMRCWKWRLSVVTAIPICCRSTVSMLQPPSDFLSYGQVPTP